MKDVKSAGPALAFSTAFTWDSPPHGAEPLQIAFATLFQSSSHESFHNTLGNVPEYRLVALFMPQCFNG
ncbi:MAG: hypothetical protein NTV46_18425, partial [Verrucomicrobia bacterium]|nr:hypothetical protein [Verrucomicrobiota bacterium]